LSDLKEEQCQIVNEAGEEEKRSLVVHRDDFWASISKCEPHQHYSSIFFSTSSPSSSNTVAPRLWFPTMSSSKVALAKP
jgi:hypothetical protein